MLQIQKVRSKYIFIAGAASGKITLIDQICYANLMLFDFIQL